MFELMKKFNFTLTEKKGREDDRNMAVCDIEVTFSSSYDDCNSPDRNFCYLPIHTIPMKSAMAPLVKGLKDDRLFR